MTSITKNIILSIVILAIIVIAGVGYAYSRKHTTKNQKTQAAIVQPAPDWVQVTNGRPAHLPDVPMIAPNEVLVSRYYIEQKFSGPSIESITHGEYKYTVENTTLPSGETAEDIYLKVFAIKRPDNNNWVVKQSGSIIDATQGENAVHITFMNNGQAQTIVDITYTYAQQ